MHHPAPTSLSETNKAISKRIQLISVPKKFYMETAGILNFPKKTVISRFRQALETSSREHKHIHALSLLDDTIEWYPGTRLCAEVWLFKAEIELAMFHREYAILVLVDGLRSRAEPAELLTSAYQTITGKPYKFTKPAALAVEIDPASLDTVNLLMRHWRRDTPSSTVANTAETQKHTDEAERRKTVRRSTEGAWHSLHNKNASSSIRARTAYTPYMDIVLSASQYNKYKGRSASGSYRASSAAEASPNTEARSATEQMQPYSTRMVPRSRSSCVQRNRMRAMPSKLRQNSAVINHTEDNVVPEHTDAESTHHTEEDNVPPLAEQSKSIPETPSEIDLSTGKKARRRGTKKEHSKKTMPSAFDIDKKSAPYLNSVVNK